jgi:hypothetical protein
MLKVKNGIIIQGRFDNPEQGLVKLVRESTFSTIIIHTKLNNYEDKCKAIVDQLAGEGLQYAKKYVIARAAYES